jgi:hypothetical protein
VDSDADLDVECNVKVVTCGENGGSKREIDTSCGAGSGCWDVEAPVDAEERDSADKEVSISGTAVDACNASPPSPAPMPVPVVDLVCSHSVCSHKLMDSGCREVLRADGWAA